MLLAYSPLGGTCSPPSAKLVGLESLLTNAGYEVTDEVAREQIKVAASEGARSALNFIENVRFVTGLAVTESAGKRYAQRDAGLAKVVDAARVANDRLRATALAELFDSARRDAAKFGPALDEADTSVRRALEARSEARPPDEVRRLLQFARERRAGYSTVLAADPVRGLGGGKNFEVRIFESVAALNSSLGVLANLMPGFVEDARGPVPLTDASFAIACEPALPAIWFLGHARTQSEAFPNAPAFQAPLAAAPASIPGSAVLLSQEAESLVQLRLAYERIAPSKVNDSDWPEKFDSPFVVKEDMDAVEALASASAKLGLEYVAEAFFIRQDVRKGTYRGLAELVKEVHANTGYRIIRKGDVLLCVSVDAWWLRQFDLTIEDASEFSALDSKSRSFIADIGRHIARLPAKRIAGIVLYRTKADTHSVSLLSHYPYIRALGDLNPSEMDALFGAGVSIADAPSSPSLHRFLSLLLLTGDYSRADTVRAVVSTSTRFEDPESQEVLWWDGKTEVERIGLAKDVTYRKVTEALISFRVTPPGSATPFLPSPLRHRFGSVEAFKVPEGRLGD